MIIILTCSSTIVDSMFINEIWTPDLYFYNTRVGKKKRPRTFQCYLAPAQKDSNNHEKSSTRRGLWLEKGKNTTEVNFFQFTQCVWMYMMMTVPLYLAFRALGCCILCALKCPDFCLSGLTRSPADLSHIHCLPACMLLFTLSRHSQQIY